MKHISNSRGSSNDSICPIRQKQVLSCIPSRLLDEFSDEKEEFEMFPKPIFSSDWRAEKHSKRVWSFRPLNYAPNIPELNRAIIPRAHRQLVFKEQRTDETHCVPLLSVVRSHRAARPVFQQVRMGAASQSSYISLSHSVNHHLVFHAVRCL